ncbi:hypothetical protein [Candidatus Entotheonella palauensis]|uniref:Uncharacterized protein n=1 Tax=Candidatus Entotheonella gemina TaxID=1429439 RepID=W4LVM4_9BACT|nr:hypothetical protein [Candidatus Entotheonella palauensis]ETX01422.1 MAG: hypothetical protein ETSY2_37240 [Candidatus Entotheonella gemina]
MQRTKKWINLIMALGVILVLGLAMTARTLTHHRFQRWKAGTASRFQSTQELSTNPVTANSAS